MAEQRYLTVGDLARHVGVTVRTIQYYDQQGLLAPSAKGPQNQRLYTEEDANDLYRILTLKYLGLSLMQIKADADLYKDPAAVRSLADAQADAIEEQFQSLFTRMTTLRALRDEAPRTDWRRLAEVIEHRQDEGPFFWRLIGIRDDAADRQAAQDRAARSASVSRWHELIADAIRLMSSSLPLDDAANRDLARRYCALGSREGAEHLDEQFVLMENIAPHADGSGSFDELQRAVFEHLKAVAAAWRASADASEAPGTSDAPDVPDGFGAPDGFGSPEAPEPPAPPGAPGASGAPAAARP